MRKSIYLAAATLGCFAPIGKLSAAVVTFSPSVTTTDEAQILQTTIDAAFTFSSASTSYTVDRSPTVVPNEVIFKGVNSGSAVTYAPSGISVTVPGLLGYAQTGVYTAPTTVGSAFDSVMDSFAYNVTGFTLGGLTQGRAYTVQLFASDDRSSSSTRTQSFGAPGSTSSNTFSQSTSPYVIATFTANAATQAFTVTSNNSGILNALVVSSVPEPTALLLGSIGMLTLLRRRR